MEATVFVRSIRQRVIEKDLLAYQDMLVGSKLGEDSTWKEVLLLYNGLNDSQKKVFLDLIRLIQVNAVSHMFGIIDGSTYLNEERATFILKSEVDNVTLYGELQDLFWEMEQGER